MCSMKWATPASAGVSRREPARTYAAMETERAPVTLALITRGPRASASACSASGTAAGAQLQIPDVVAGKFNVAMVLIGPHDDGGWSQAHYEGLQYVCDHIPDSHVAYIELVPEGADSETVFRSLAR